MRDVPDGAEAPDESVAPVRPGKFEALEAGRGIAAVFVLVSHANAIVGEPRFYGREIWPTFFRFGAGVDFFFVLSGFIIAWAHWRDIGRPQRLRHYAVRRFRRIYPAYWVVLVPLSLAYFLFPRAGVPSQHDPLNFVFSFLLLPYPAPPILGVAWTLVYEIIFYVLFGMVILFGRAAFPLLSGWGAAVFVANLISTTFPFPFSTLLDSANLEFLLGVSAAFALRHRAIPVPALLAVAGPACFLALMLLGPPVIDHPLASRLGYGIAAAAGMLGMVELERTGRIATPRLLRHLGAASYALYLIHGEAISVTIQVVTRATHLSLPPVVAMTILVVAGIVAGVLFHRFVERPLGRRLNRPSAA